MTHDSTNPPAPELLSAYADGELGESDRARVEAWLVADPAAAKELDQYRRLARAWDSTSAPEPTPTAWHRTSTAIAAGRPALPRRDWARWAAGLTALAAAAALLVLLTRQAPLPLNPTPVVPEEEPWPVASADEVIILSMRDADTGSLVVGEPPVRDYLTIASANDVRIVDVKPDPDGTTMQRMNDGTPMIVPVAANRP